MNRTGKSSTVGEWTTPTGKIGLIYASDYGLSLGYESLNLTGASNDVLKTGWINQSNNDTTKSAYEWTMSRESYNLGMYHSWLIYENGTLGAYGGVRHAYGVRPVFYITSNAKTSGGDGTLENPFIISE